MRHRLPAPTLRWSRTFILLCASVFVIVYAIVLLLYAQSGRADSGTPIDNSHDGLHVVLTPRNVDAAQDRIDVALSIAPGSALVSSDGLTAAEDFRLLLPGAQAHDGQILTFIADGPIAPTTLQLSTAGAIERWPFDVHTLHTLALVSTPGPDDEAVPVPTDLSLAEHHVPGWTLTLREDVSATPVTAAGDTVVHQYVLEARRATATVAFGVVLLILMIAMPVLGLSVAILALRGKRAAEVGFFTWNAGMLFATPMLRNFLPGQPPIGSWVDYLIVLWTIAGLILALLISVVAWYRWSGPRADTERVSAPAPPG